MLWLNDHIRRIEDLLAEGAAESLTFAALRCRMAIELVCYDRLRIAHDYISHADLCVSACKSDPLLGDIGVQK